MTQYYGTPEELLPRMTELLSGKGGFWLTVTGHSMTPTLRHLKDRVYIGPFSGKAKRGDILLVSADNGHCLLHRVERCVGNVLYLRGDALNRCEGPFPATHVVGIVTAVEHGGQLFPVNVFFQGVSLVRREFWRFRRKFVPKVKSYLTRRMPFGPPDG